MQLVSQNDRVSKESKYKGFLILKFALLLVLLESIHAWFTWPFNGRVIWIFAIIICAYFLSQNPASTIITKGKLLIIFLFTVVIHYSKKDSDLNAILGVSLLSILFSIVVLLKDSIKIELFEFFTKAIAVILSISLFGWILFLIGIPLPSFPTSFNFEQYHFDNYIFFINDTAGHIIIPRFSSVFLEPGYLGALTTFFMFGNRFDIKRKEIIVMLIASILSFSLAAYVLIIISAFMILVLNNNKKIYLVLFLICLVYAGYVFFSSYNNGNNVVNTLIIERLKYDEGELSGDNRVSIKMESFYENVMKGPDKYLGIGDEEYINNDLGAAAGYRVFILKQGIVGTILLCLFYLSMVFYYKSKFTFAFFVIYILSFLQAQYALWPYELLIFITAVPLLKTYKQNKI